MAPGTVLAALVETGIVTLQDDGFYRLENSAFLPDAGSDAQVAAYRATLTAHLSAATHNLLAAQDDPRHFDRVVRYSHLSDEAVEELTRAASEKAQSLLEEINAMARELQEKDAATRHAADDLPLVPISCRRRIREMRNENVSASSDPGLRPAAGNEPLLLPRTTRTERAVSWVPALSERSLIWAASMSTATTSCSTRT